MRLLQRPDYKKLPQFFVPYFMTVRYGYGSRFQTFRVAGCLMPPSCFFFLYLSVKVFSPEGHFCCNRRKFFCQRGYRVKNSTHKAGRCWHY